MRAFDYRAPATVHEAVALLSRQGADARPLAGGTDLLVQLRRGDRDTGLLVDVKRIPELTRIHLDPEKGLTLGAAVPCFDVASHSDVIAWYAALSDAAGLIGGTAIRSRATMGGNLCNAAPSADTTPALLVLEATCVIRGPAGERSVPASEFCTAPGCTVLAPGELLLSIKLPAPRANCGSRYLRFIPRGEMDIAVVGAACVLELNTSKTKVAAARVALAAVAPTPLLVAEAARALVGRGPTEEAFGRAARAAQNAARPIDDLRGSAAFRRHLVGVLVKRALRDALRRAQGERVDG